MSFGVLFLFSFLLVSCGVDNLNGSYESDSDVHLVIDGDDAIYSWYSLAKNGTIDKKNNTIIFKDNKKTEKYSYKLVGDKLSLSNGNTTIALNKVSDDVKSKNKKETNESSEVDEQKDSSSESEESNSNLSTKKSKNSSKSESTVNVQGESIDITTKGEYFVGSDIKPGTYYIVLTELNYADDDPEKQAWVSFDISGKKPDYEMLFNVGSKKRIVLSDGDTVTFEDNYSPKSWMMRLLNDDDFKKYTEENK